jgi:hypothetical protein
MSHPLPGSGWMFVTKKHLNDTSDWEWVVYPVAYFQDGFPWFATPASAVLRKPTPAQEFWGTLVSPGQSTAAAWNELKAAKRVYLKGVATWLKEVLVRFDGWKCPREQLRGYADEEFPPVAVTVALSHSDFTLVPGEDDVMYWTLTEGS